MADSDFETSLDQLDGQLGQSAEMIAAFNGELSKLGQTVGQTGYDVNTLERGLTKGLRGAFDGLVLDGNTLSDSLKSLGQSIVNTAYSAAVQPVADHFGSMLAGGVNSFISGMMPFADGGVISQGRVTPFAKGGVFDGPVSFPMRGGTGLMGEAGPEAIMPLKRGADGKLGVAASGGGGGVTVNMNIQTPDVAGFQRSQTQIAAQMSRALQRSHRNN